LVASGAYASASDVIRASLAALREKDHSLDRWLRDGAGPTVDAMRRNPSAASMKTRFFKV
jgi:antitoxin ParD1/3/4